MVNICVPRLQVLNVHTSIISLFVFLSPEVWTYSGTTGRLGDVKRCSCNFTLSRPWGIITLLDAWTFLRSTQFYTCTTTSNPPTLVYVLLHSPQLLSDTSSVEPHCMTYSSGITTFCLFFFDWCWMNFLWEKAHCQQLGDYWHLLTFCRKYAEFRSSPCLTGSSPDRLGLL